jgi:CO/xanthine dehydrogenase FAD-binding subunit
MLANILRVLRPATIDEAVQHLAEGGGRVKAMAGGTANAVFRSRRVEAIVDLWTLPLRYVRATDDGLRVGATATMADIARSEHARAWAGGVLAAAAASAGSTPLRNLITAGGNLASLYPWSDLPPALLALDARVRLAGPAASEMTVEDLVAQHPSAVLGNAFLVTEIVVPRVSGRVGSTFVKVGASAVDYAWLDVAALVEVEDGRCTRCRLAVGAVEARCRRLPEVEEAVVGNTVDASLAGRAGDLAAGLVQPLRDPRVGVDYRRDLVRVHTRRALLEAWRRAASEGGAR